MPHKAVKRLTYHKSQVAEREEQQGNWWITLASFNVSVTSSAFIVVQSFQAMM